MIPKVIYQTWATKELSDGMNKLSKSWKINNPFYKYIIYDDNDCYEFIKKNFNKDILEAYNNLKYNALKADLWRYCILYLKGGFYADIDTLCMSSLDSFYNKKTELVTPIDFGKKYHLFNAFIGVIPKHPIMKYCIESIVENTKKKTDYKDKRDVAGPGVLGKATNMYLKRDKETVFDYFGYLKLNNDNNIHFLWFRYVDQHILDIKFRKTLFQNKNGNKQIENIYKKECKRLNISVEWGTNYSYIN